MLEFMVVLALVAVFFHFCLTIGLGVAYMSDGNYQGRKNPFSWYIWHAKKLLAVRNGGDNPWGGILGIGPWTCHFLKSFMIYWAIIPFAIIIGTFASLHFLFGTLTGWICLIGLVAAYYFLRTLSKISKLFLHFVTGNKVSKGARIIKGVSSIVKKAAQEADRD